MSNPRVMLDTNTVSYLMRERDSRLQDKLTRTGVSRVCISSITEGELRFGVLQHPAATALPRLVDSFLARVDSLPWDSEAARSYAVLRKHCKVSGFNLSNMDMLIGAHSMAVDTILITNDRAFSHLSDMLRLDNWITG